MGLYKRARSPFWWMFLERTGTFQSTKIRHDAPTPAQRKENRQLAEELYHAAATTEIKDAQKKPAISFADFADWYAAHVLPRHRGAERERELLIPLRARLAALDLSTIDRTVATEYATARLVNVSPRTVNREIDLLKAMLTAAVPKYLASSPIYGMPRLRVVKPKRRLMTPADEQKLLKALAPADRALFLLGLDSLVRLGDILDLKWADVNLKTKTAYIADPKDKTQGEPYSVPLSKRTVAALKPLAKSGDYVFPHRRKAKTERDRRGSIRKMLESACARAGIPTLRFHWATRRTGATRMLRAGSPIAAVQQLGHWADPHVLLGIYNEALDRDVRAAVELPAVKTRR